MEEWATRMSHLLVQRGEESTGNGRVREGNRKVSSCPLLSQDWTSRSMQTSLIPSQQQPNRRS